jgi:hypothetical protein
VVKHVCKTIFQIALAGVVLIPAVPASAAPFTINVIFNGGLTASQEAIFSTAASTWVGLLPGYQPGISIPSLDITATGATIDGPGGILGSAGPNTFSNQGGYLLSTAGAMTFDAADLATLESNGSLLAVILHEMAHVMGLGTLWSWHGIYSNGTGQYTGANALAAYRTEFNQPVATFVPVELGGGAGTANGHWNEVDGGGSTTGIVSAQGDMRNELMTGWLNSPYFISNMTVQSFVDIGYSDTSPMPEPGTFALFAAGLAGVVVLRGRVKKS